MLGTQQGSRGKFSPLQERKCGNTCVILQKSFKVCSFVGVYELIVPKDNRGDFERLPDYIREGITIHYADYFEDVIKAAF